MALVFPRDMVGGLRWRSPRLTIKRRQELSRAAGGPSQGKDLGPSLWVAEMRSVPLRLNAADAAMADFETLGGVLETLLVHPTRRPRPVSISSDAPLASASVTVASIRADNRALALAGLPGGFEITAGDYLSIATSSGGLEFHQFARGGAASGTGETAQLEVVPHIRPSVDAGAAVTLLRPPLEMMLEPGSLDDPYAGLSHREISFRAVQVVR